jgi:hypothetical protein
MDKKALQPSSLFPHSHNQFYSVSSFIGKCHKRLNGRDTAMRVLSLSYWMLTKKVSQGLRGDYHP